MNKQDHHYGDSQIDAAAASPPSFSITVNEVYLQLAPTG